MIRRRAMRLIGRPTYGVSSTPPLSTSDYLLDTPGLTNAIGAFSLRKLRNAYAGSCVLIRRSNDNAEAAIGFSGNWINKAAVDAHCTTNDGYVVTWYDQSGNGNNISQTTAAGQFKIWDGARRDWMVTIGGKPATMPLGVPDPTYKKFAVIPQDNSSISIGVICGFAANTSSAVLQAAFGGQYGSICLYRFPNTPHDSEVFNNSSISNMVPGVTPAANTSYVCGFAANLTAGITTTTIRHLGVTYSTTGGTYPSDQSAAALLQIGGGGKFASPDHTFQEAIWWTRDIGNNGLTLYAGNSLSSSWYGSASYV